MTEHWQRVRGLFQQAFDQGPDSGAAWAAAICESEDDVRQEVLELLIAHGGAGTFMETPPVVDDHVADSGNGWIGRRVGAYRIVRELGRGGMGRVFLAERDDAQFDKQVAIKIVRLTADADRMLERFGHERRILAALEHANIARLLDAGTTDDDVPYVVMEYVDGLPIDEYCDRHELSTSDRLLLFRRMCVAVHHAHERSIIHRDIKASNILVTADGTPKLLDFGIAKLVESNGTEAQQTETAFRVMTPSNAAPEQVIGAPVTAATDVYALGALLYQLMTGRLAHDLRDKTQREVIRTICEIDPEAPSAASNRKNLAGDIDTIVLKTLRKEPNRRYLSAKALADDIGRHLEGRPVLAAPDQVTYRARKFVGRHKQRISIAMAFSMLAAVAIGTSIGAARGDDGRRRVAPIGTRHPEAHHAYLKGRHFWNMRTAEGFTKALGYFQDAIDKDPTYAAAYAGLADTYALLGSIPYAVMPASEASGKARAAALKALEIDNTLAEAEVSLAFITYSFDWNWQGGEEHFKRAIALDPDNVRAHYWYALYLGQLGRTGEALSEAQRALDLEPLGLVGTYAVGLANYLNRRFDPATKYFKAALEIAPEFSQARRLLGATYLAERRYVEALGELRQVSDAAPENPFHAAWLAHAYARAGDDERARALLNGLVGESKKRFIPAVSIAIGYLGLGDLNTAMQWLERAYDERSQALTFLNSEPIYDPLRSNPRFQDLRRQVGFPTNEPSRKY